MKDVVTFLHGEDRIVQQVLKEGKMCRRSGTKYVNTQLAETKLRFSSLQGSCLGLSECSSLLCQLTCQFFVNAKIFYTQYNPETHIVMSCVQFSDTLMAIKRERHEILKLPENIVIITYTLMTEEAP